MPVRLDVRLSAALAANRKEQPLRVAEIISGRGVNGAAIHCLTLAQALARRGHQVTIVCRPGAWIGRRAFGHQIAVELSTLGCGSIRELRRVAKILRAGGVEVVHTHMSDAHLFGVMLRLFFGLPSVATAHSTFIQVHWPLNDAVIAVSEACARFHRRWNLVPARRLHVVKPFVDVEALAPIDERERARVRLEFGLDPSALIVGFVGSVFREKGVRDLVAAWPRIIRAVPRAHLAIVGGGRRSFLDELRAYTKRSGAYHAVSWLGIRDDASRLVAAVDVLALPSWHETAGLAALEAMASAVPVVATDVGGLPEFVRHGVTGLIVKPHAVDALGDALVSLLSDRSKREAYGTASRKTAEAFSVAAQVPKIEAVLRSVAERRA